MPGLLKSEGLPNEIIGAAPPQQNRKAFFYSSYLPKKPYFSIAVTNGYFEHGIFRLLFIRNLIFWVTSV